MIAPAATKPTVYEAWALVMADVKAVGKTGHNKQQDYSFRGIDGVLNAAGPAMRQHGVFIMPSLIKATYRDVKVGKNATPMREVTVEVRYTIIGPAGDPLRVPDDPNFGVVPAESMDSGDKATAKAMSVAYRIFLLQALSIPTHEPDADESSYERAAPQSTTSLKPGELTAKDAKARLLTFVAGDKDAAKTSWATAGLDGRHVVTEEELTAAMVVASTAATEGTGDAHAEPAPTEGEGAEPAPPGSALTLDEPSLIAEHDRQVQDYATKAERTGS